MTIIAEKFYSGLYADIVAELIDSPTSKRLTAPDAVYATGSLSFLGRTDEADAIFDANQRQMTLRESMESRFYLVLAHRRLRKKSSTRKASLILVSMFKDLRLSGSSDDFVKYFFFCSLAFFRYTDTRLTQALKWARKAYDHAFRAQFSFGRLVGYDLMGHAQLNLGEIRAGIKNLNNSSAIADALGRGAIRQSTEVSLRLYRSTFGLDRASVLLAELEGAIRASSFENSYTLANLYIELARLQILSGSGHIAEQSLKEAGDWVYKLDQPFFDANLSFRYAHLACLKGDYKKALELVRSAKMRVSEANDAAMETRILGLEAKILLQSGKTTESETLAGEIRHLEAKSGLLLARRINERLGISPREDIRRGEDLLGDLMDDLAYHATDIRERILDSGFLGLIPSLIEVPQFSQAILFGYLGDSVTILAKGHVRHEPDGWPDLVKKLFLALAAQSELNKEEITVKVWNQVYNPLRHDPLIYALVARARKMLEPYDAWLTVNDGKYLIDQAITIRDISQKITAPQNRPHVASELLARHPDLSARHAKIMDLCEQMGNITNKDVCDAFKTTEVTAGRDLTELVKKGLLRRLGKGRATSYAKA